MQMLLWILQLGPNPNHVGHVNGNGLGLGLG